MKNGTTHHNSFDVRTNFYLLEDNAWECAYCGKNHANCLHHIFGRGSPDDDCEKSPLNASPMNNHYCHLPFHGKHMTREGRQRLLQFTWKTLLKNNYKLTDRDLRFLDKYKEEFSQMNLCLD